MAAMKGGPPTGARPRRRSPTGRQEIDADIDGPRGDLEVRFVPKRWSGQDYKGQKFSSCEPEFPRHAGGRHEWFAQRDDESNAVDKNGTPKSRWSRLDAARARAWSARLRGGAAPARAPPPCARPRADERQRPPPARQRHGRPRTSARTTTTSLLISAGSARGRLAFVAVEGDDGGEREVHRQHQHAGRGERHEARVPAHPLGRDEHPVGGSAGTTVRT